MGYSPFRSVTLRPLLLRSLPYSCYGTFKAIVMPTENVGVQRSRIICYKKGIKSQPQHLILAMLQLAVENDLQNNTIHFLINWLYVFMVVKKSFAISELENSTVNCYIDPKISSEIETKNRGSAVPLHE